MSFDLSSTRGAVELRHLSNLSSPPASGSRGSHSSTEAGAGGVLGARQKRSDAPVKVAFSPVLEQLVAAKAASLGLSPQDALRMLAAAWVDPQGTLQVPARVPSGYPSPKEGEVPSRVPQGSLQGTARVPGGTSLARVEESLFPTTHEEEEPKEKQGGSREGAKKRKEMPAPPAEIAAVVELWLAYKRDRGESYKSAAGLKELYNKLSEWGPERAFAAVKHSMASNWAGVFEANGSGGGNGRTREPDIRRTAGAHKEPQVIVNYSRYEPPEPKP